MEEDVAGKSSWFDYSIEGEHFWFVMDWGHELLSRFSMEAVFGAIHWAIDEWLLLVWYHRSKSCWGIDKGKADTKGKGTSIGHVLQLVNCSILQNHIRVLSSKDWPFLAVPVSKHIRDVSCVQTPYNPFLFFWQVCKVPYVWISRL